MVPFFQQMKNKNDGTKLPLMEDSDSNVEAITNNL